MPIDKDQVTITTPTLNEREAIEMVLDEIMKAGLLLDVYN
jgi:hypothetical protein